MISNVRGDFPKIAAEAVYDPKRPESGKITVRIETNSIHTRDEKRDEHLKSADFLDVAKFPAITFVSRTVRRNGAGFELVGDLTIRDVTREVVLAVDEVTAEHGDPWGNRRFGATAKTKIHRSDFGITWNAALEAGGLLVGDEVAISVEAEFIKQA